jgi:aspartate aminotransferase-like enzyme
MDRVDHSGELASPIAGRRPTLKAPEVFSVRVGFRDFVGNDDDVVLIVCGVFVDSFEQVHKDNRVRLVWIRVTPKEPFDIHAADDDADIVLRDFGEGVLVDADTCAGHGRE